MILSYRGRRLSPADIDFIRQLIAEHPGASRRALSAKLCEAWNWRQANGTLCDMVCRGLMLALHRAGHIELPPIRWANPNPLGKRRAERRPPSLPLLDTTPLSGKLSEIQPLEFQQVRRTGDERLFNGLIERYHYLGYTQPVGEHLKYLVYVQGRPIAALGWSSAPRHLGPRDRFIGWPAEARRRNIRYLAYNTRFLILALRSGRTSCFSYSGPPGAKDLRGLGATLRAPDLLSGDLCRSGTISGHLLRGGQLEGAGADRRSGQGLAQQEAQSIHQRCIGISA